MSKLLEAQENTSDRISIGFGLGYHWPKERREFSRQIKDRREAKPMQTSIFM